MKFRLSVLLPEIHTYLQMQGMLVCNIASNYVAMYVSCILYIHTCRQRVESLILSTQISTDPQKRMFHDGDTVQLTFNIGMV